MLRVKAAIGRMNKGYRKIVAARKRRRKEKEKGEADKASLSCFNIKYA